MQRLSPRVLALRAAAVVLAVVTAAVVGTDLAALHRRAGDLGPVQHAIVATRDLAIGDTVARGDVSIRSLYRSQLLTGVAHDVGDVVGRVVAAPILRGGFVTGRNLAPDARTGVDGIVPEGMRAIRVTVTGSIRPRAGAAVDVLASYDARTVNEAQEAATTVVVAAGVLVLSTDTRATGGTGRGDALGVTVLVDPSDAARLADAQVNGVLTLALVPPEEATR